MAIATAGVVTAALTAVFAFFGAFVLLWNVASRRREFVARLPGPPSNSWLVGNLPDLRRVENAGDIEFGWVTKYGSAFRIQGCFGEHVLYLCDPKALQYILNRRGDIFPKTWESHALARIGVGRGIVGVEGANHARQRRIMMPSFSHAALQGYFPLFLELSRKTTLAWKKAIRRQNAESAVLNVWGLLGRTTLDIIGRAAFDYKFNSIDAEEPNTELHKTYQNLFVDVHYMPSNFAMIFRRLHGYFPECFTDVIKLLPIKDIRRLSSLRTVSGNVARGLVDRQIRAVADGEESGKDVMSIFIAANNAEDPKRRLEEDEILSQITVLMLAGHETTANSLSWTLYELARHPEAQRKLRDEVRATFANVASRGQLELTTDDLGSMKYLIAVLKETLRYHSIAEQLPRRAACDDAIPLDTPIHTDTGETFTTIPVRKGQVLHLALTSYNRLCSIWGPDADEWKPERFLHEESLDSQKINFGVFANLATFGSGMRSCIGWRFALMVMQVVLIELLDKFSFSPVPNVEIKRVPSGVIQSMVKGQENKGAQMPLCVTILPETSKDSD